MAIAFNWEITQLECYPEQDGMSDVVFKIGWSRHATDGAYSACQSGSQLVTLDPEGPFTPYANLTFEQVCGWLEGAMNKLQFDAMNAALTKEIENQIIPPVVAQPLPWRA